MFSTLWLIKKTDLIKQFELYKRKSTLLLTNFNKEQDKESTRTISNEWANISQYEIGERGVHIKRLHLLKKTYVWDTRKGK